jgi:predicted nucleic acid-binding protein
MLMAQSPPMKSPIFIDTGYILALLNTADAHHDRAVGASRQVKPPFLTTEAVLTEIGNALSQARWRALGYATIQDLRADSNIEVE